MARMSTLETKFPIFYQFLRLSASQLISKRLLGGRWAMCIQTYGLFKLLLLPIQSGSYGESCFQSFLKLFIANK